MLRHILIVASLAIFSVVGASARDIVKISGEADYFSPDSESPKEARENAIRQARISALEKQFGLVITEHIVTKQQSFQGKTQCLAQSLGESDVRGEWLDDTSRPIITTTPTDYGTVYHVKVYGQAREIPNNRIDVDCRLLFNGMDRDRNLLRGGEYHQGDECYLYFNSPVSGWLTVFIADDDEVGTMQCMLPYDGQDIKSYPIKADTGYTFFSKATAEPNCVEYATRMIMESRKHTDINVFYIIFSPKEFSKPPTYEFNADKHSDTNVASELMPRETDFKAFHRWLSGRRKNDPDLQVIKIPVSISK